MLKKFLILVLASIFLGGCSLSPKKSGIEIISYPTAKVFINNKEMGSTPYKNLDLKPGDNEIKLVSGTREWKKTIELQNNINTVIDWQLSDDSSGDSGYILYLEKTGDKKPSLLVNTNPNKTTVKIDGEVKGISPIKINGLGEGDRQLVVSFPGYKDVNIFMKAIAGYQLVVNAQLAKEKNDIGQIIEPPTEATNSSLNLDQDQKIIIKETETGWLKVRESSSSSSKEITKVNPGESYVLLEEGIDWYKIDLGSSGNGWISATYASKN
ncbi:MAG: PEGA domain-containing protein [Candidatus Shapirobacteria bacterium]|nr:PEGA domain-containing protein [Candidatus Shapirobacteria bacterium]